MQPTEPSPEPVGPRISVVIASRNSQEVLSGCLDSLAAAGAASGSLEVVSVDLGSVDGSPELDTAYPWLVVMRLPRNFGRTRAWNVGIRVAHGEYVVLMDPRIRIEPKTMETMAAVLDDRQDASAAICQLIDEKGDVLAQTFPLPDRAALRASSLANDDPPASIPEGDTVQAARGWLIMVRRRFIAGMNYLDEKRYWDSWAEVDLFRQVRSSGKKTLSIDGARATLTGKARRPFTIAGRALEAADRAAGACSYLAKQEGFISGLTFRLGLILSSFGRALTFREPGYHLRLFAHLLSGAKVDGTQGGELS